jgi:hypothetical protein
MTLRSPFHRRRQPYLERLAVYPMFAGVPRHLLPVLGHTLEQVVLREGGRARCAHGDVLIVVDGCGVLTRNGRPLFALDDAAVLDTARTGEYLDDLAVVATMPLRMFVVTRRNVASLRAVVPELDAALARDPGRESSSVPRPRRAPVRV